MVRTVVVVGLFAATAAVAQVPVADRPLVFVADVTAAPGLEADASSLTSSLCGAVARDKRFDVLCAPDVRQILGFAAMSSATGAASPAVEKLQSRLEHVDYVVNGTLNQRAKDELVFVVVAGPRAADADASAPYTDKVLVKLEEVGTGKSARLLDRLPEIATRIGGALLPASPSTTAPPAPLPAKK